VAGGAMVAVVVGAAVAPSLHSGQAVALGARVGAAVAVADAVALGAGEGVAAGAAAGVGVAGSAARQAPSRAVAAAMWMKRRRVMRPVA